MSKLWGHHRLKRLGAELLGAVLSSILGFFVGYQFDALTAPACFDGIVVGRGSTSQTIYGAGGAESRWPTAFYIVVLDTTGHNRVVWVGHDDAGWFRAGMADIGSYFTNCTTLREEVIDSGPQGGQEGF